MHAPSRSTALLVALAAAACYDKPAPVGVATEATDDGSTSGTAEVSLSGPESSSSAATTNPTSSATDASTTTPGDETSGSSGAPSTNDSGDVDSTGGGAVTICDQGASSLAVCTDSAEGVAAVGTLGCDATVTDFSVFFEDIYSVELSAGQCLYVHVDNIGEAGPTMMNAADIALQVRSPSGAYTFADDEVACSDAAWTGGACPQALVLADVDGTYQIGIVQASGAGCTAFAPYSFYAANGGVAFTPDAPAVDDLMTSCDGA